MGCCSASQGLHGLYFELTPYSFAEMLRFKPSNLTRFTAEPLKRARYSSMVRLCQSAFVMARSSDLG